ncbi:MAG: hypothetical protein COB02_07535 [Candidatus Cloacimonadota bacterium]|nr:MAG: hypothetical protein COB02_07535 [Candidatus Cloacimonadota bacterium]
MQKMMTVDTTSLDGLTFDGNDLWISDISEKMVKKVSIAEQSIIKEIKFLPSGIPRAISFVNDALLISNYDSVNESTSEIIQLNVMNGKTLRTLNCPSFIDSGIAFDNENFWGASCKEQKICKFLVDSGEAIQEFQYDHPVLAIGWTGHHLIAAFDKMDTDKSCEIALINPKDGKVISKVDISNRVSGVTYAENMIFYTNSDLKEIQVTKLKG